MEHTPAAGGGAGIAQHYMAALSAEQAEQFMWRLLDKSTQQPTSGRAHDRALDMAVEAAHRLKNVATATALDAIECRLLRQHAARTYGRRTVDHLLIVVREGIAARKMEVLKLLVTQAVQQPQPQAQHKPT